MATSVQFSIRALLIAMVLTAVGLAAGLPVIRSWDSPTRFHFLLDALVVSACFILSLVHRCAARRRVERLVGKVVFKVAAHGLRFARIQWIALLLLYVAAAIYMAASRAHRATPAAYDLLDWLHPLFVGLVASLLMTHCWWNTGPGVVELAKNGLIEAATRFTPYHRLATFRWDRWAVDTLVLSSHNRQFTQITVPRAERERIVRLLEEKGLVLQRTEAPSPKTSSQADQRRADHRGPGG
ncbi:MAG: hypothetical protein GXX96_34690 [Planctomycetaceae bacterium]|nr:hypothetical protein [Planctomycetaceae bacterium]